MGAGEISGGEIGLYWHAREGRERGKGMTCGSARSVEARATRLRNERLACWPGWQRVR